MTKNNEQIIKPCTICGTMECYEDGENGGCDLAKYVIAKEQECETLASQLDFEVQKKECLEQEIEKLKDKLSCCFCNPILPLNDSEKLRKCFEVTECFRRQLDQLKAENEELKEELQKYINREQREAELAKKRADGFKELRKMLYGKFDGSSLIENSARRKLMW